MTEMNIAPMPERRPERSAWLDPRFIVTLIGLAMTVILSVGGTILANETRATRDGTKNDERWAKMDEFKTTVNEKLSSIDKSVQTVSVSLASLQTAQAQDRVEINESKADIKVLRDQLNAWVGVVNKDVALVKARQEAEKGR